MKKKLAEFTRLEQPATLLDLSMFMSVAVIAIAGEQHISFDKLKAAFADITSTSPTLLPLMCQYVAKVLPTDAEHSSAKQKRGPPAST